MKSCVLARKCVQIINLNKQFKIIMRLQNIRGISIYYISKIKISWSHCYVFESLYLLQQRHCILIQSSLKKLFNMHINISIYKICSHKQHMYMQ